jgi:hypothetical protein
LFEHDLFGKPDSTFPDLALISSLQNLSVVVIPIKRQFPAHSISTTDQSVRAAGAGTSLSPTDFVFSVADFGS